MGLKNNMYLVLERLEVSLVNEESKNTLYFQDICLNEQQFSIEVNQYISDIQTRACFMCKAGLGLIQWENTLNAFFHW